MSRFIGRDVPYIINKCFLGQNKLPRPSGPTYLNLAPALLSKYHGQVIRARVYRLFDIKAHLIKNAEHADVVKEYIGGEAEQASFLS
jgi:hypothetical protein